MHGFDEQEIELLEELFATRLLGEIGVWLGYENSTALLGDERSVAFQLGIRPGNGVGIHNDFAGKLPHLGQSIARSQGAARYCPPDLVGELAIDGCSRCRVALELYGGLTVLVVLVH